MRLGTLICAATAALALLAARVPAQQSFETVGGNTYSGKVVSDDGTNVEIETAGGAKVKVPFDALTPKTQYSLKRAKTGEDGKSQLALAEWCLSKTLYEEARTHYRKALAADATMADEINAKVVVARKTAANELLARAKGLMATDPKQARRILSQLVQELPLEDATGEARKLLAADTEQRKSDALARKPKTKPAPAAGADAGQPAPTRASGEPFSEPVVKRFQDVIDSYHKMLDSTRDGLTEGGSGSVKEFEKALKEGDKIRKAVDKIRPDAKGDEELTEAVELADSKLEDADVDARLNIVDCYLMRTSYNQASDVVKEGLANYPKNEQLRQAMNRVTAAAADGIGGDWVIVGRR